MSTQTGVRSGALGKVLLVGLAAVGLVAALLVSAREGEPEADRRPDIAPTAMSTSSLGGWPIPGVRPEPAPSIDAAPVPGLIVRPENEIFILVADANPQIRVPGSVNITVVIGTVLGLVPPPATFPWRVAIEVPKGTPITFSVAQVSYANAATNWVACTIYKLQDPIPRSSDGPRYRITTTRCQVNVR